MRDVAPEILCQASLFTLRSHWYAYELLQIPPVGLAALNTGGTVPLTRNSGPLIVGAVNGSYTQTPIDAEAVGPLQLYAVTAMVAIPAKDALPGYHTGIGDGSGCGRVMVQLYPAALLALKYMYRTTSSKTLHGSEGVDGAPGAGVTDSVSAFDVPGV